MLCGFNDDLCSANWAESSFSARVHLQDTYLTDCFVQGLIHSNKFAGNKQTLYILHEKNVQFSRLVQQK